ncbi:MAG TPA: glycosyltransferase [Gaiellaceae bacterium]
MLVRQLLRFAIVGVGNTLLSLAVFRLLTRVSVPGTPASSAAFLVGAANGYHWNRRWTFAARDTHDARLRYVLVQGGALPVTTALYAVLASTIAGGATAYLIAVAGSTGLSFAANRRLTFHSCSSAGLQLRRRRRVDAGDMKSSIVEIVVPVHNEEADVARSVTRLHAYLTSTFPFSSRITIADNASSDGTAQIAATLAAELPDVAVLHLAKKGRGRALRAAWSRSDADVVAYMDVDLSTDLDALLPLVAPLLSGHSDVAIGTRLAHSSRVQRGLKRELISRTYNRILHAVLRVRFSDAQCGFKAVRRDALADLLPLVEDEAWFFDTELLVLAERAGLRIHEVPVDWVDDPDSRVDLVATAAADLRGVWRLLLRRRLPLTLERERNPTSDLHTA